MSKCIRLPSGEVQAPATDEIIGFQHLDTVRDGQETLNICSLADSVAPQARITMHNIKRVGALRSV